MKLGGYAKIYTICFAAAAMVSSSPSGGSLGESSDILLGRLLQHYVDDMHAFQRDLVAEDDYFNREEQCTDRLESIKATIAGDAEEIAMYQLLARWHPAHGAGQMRGPRAYTR